MVEYQHPAATEEREKIGICLPDTPRFADIFTRFNSLTSEYEHLVTWYQQWLRKGDVCLEVGPGDGTLLTPAMHAAHRRCIFIEPEAKLGEALKRRYPDELLMNSTLEELKPDALDRALVALQQHDGRLAHLDLIQLVHSLYYVPREDWLPQLGKLLIALSPGGSCLIVLTDAETAVAKIYKKYTGSNYDLVEFAREFDRGYPAWQSTTGVLPGVVRVKGFDELRQIVRFLLSYRPFDPPTTQEFDRDLGDNFGEQAAGAFEIDLRQRFLILERA